MNILHKDAISDPRYLLEAIEKGKQEEKEEKWRRMIRHKDVVSRVRNQERK